MSRALERLRDVFADDLLVRSGRAYELTVKGERLRAELDALIPRLEAMVGGGDFDPAGSRERFRIALTDHASAVLLPPLLGQVRRAAPQASLGVSAWHPGAYADVIAGRLDVALSAEAPLSPLEVEVLYEEQFVCLVGGVPPARKRRLTLHEYLDRPHVVVETWGDQQTPVDVPLAQLGFRRRCLAGWRHWLHPGAARGWSRPRKRSKGSRTSWFGIHACPRIPLTSGSVSRCESWREVSKGVRRRLPVNGDGARCLPSRP